MTSRWHLIVACPHDLQGAVAVVGTGLRLACFPDRLRIHLVDPDKPAYRVEVEDEHGARDSFRVDPSHRASLIADCEELLRHDGIALDDEPDEGRAG